MVSEYFNLLTPEENPATTVHPLRGMVNINTAPASVLKCLPGIFALTGGAAPTRADRLAEEIIAYRDKGQVGGAGGRDYADRPTTTNILDLRNQPGFATASEVAIPLRIAVQDPNLSLSVIRNEYDWTNRPPYNYFFGPAPDDDGIPIYTTRMNVRDDPAKMNLLYTWMSNQITVRSNTFLVYIRVQRDRQANSPARRYMAVIDRSRCPLKAPQVLMFTELR
jgi:hypothetical protein